MISRSHDYVEFCRENATHLKSLHDLALRGAGKEEITAAIHRRIVEETALQEATIWSTSVAETGRSCAGQRKSALAAR